MKPQFEVRQARLDDWPLIAGFIDDCYGAGAPFKNGPRWRWEFVDTPYPQVGDTPAAVWIALADGRVAGQIALQPGRMRLEGEMLPAGWIVDVMVRPEYRGFGLGHRIHDAMVASGETLVTLTMALATRRIAERAGCVTLGPVQQMVRPGRLSGRTLSTVLGRSVDHRGGALGAAGRVFIASRVGPAALAAAISAGAALARRAPQAPRGITVAETTSPDFAAAAALLDRDGADYDARFDRSPAFLDWRLRQVPDLDYRWFEARRDGALAGLATWRLPDPIELPVGTLTDVLAASDDPETVDALVGAAVAAMKDRTEAIIAGASHPTHLTALRRHGFLRVRTHWPTVVTRDAALTARLEGSKDGWHFSKLDHDWDQIHPAHD